VSGSTGALSPGTLGNRDLRPEVMTDLELGVDLELLNRYGLQRNNFPDEVIRELKRAYRLFFRSDLNVSQALERAESELQQFPEVQEFLRFVSDSGRGVVI